MLLEAKAWMDEHTSEIIVLDFGGIEYSRDTVPALGNHKFMKIKMTELFRTTISPFHLFVHIFLKVNYLQLVMSSLENGSFPIKTINILEEKRFLMKK